MSLRNFLAAVSHALVSEGIPHMLTGSMAAAIRGATRATMDIDLVIDPTARALEAFCAHMEQLGLYVSREAAREAFETRSMFNVIDPVSGWKADLILRRERPFSIAEFERREPGRLLGVPVDVARIEDLIIAKLEWARLGASARQREDVATLVALAHDPLDRPYLAQWIAALGLEAEWAAVPHPPDERGG